MSCLGVALAKALSQGRAHAPRRTISRHPNVTLLRAHHGNDLIQLARAKDPDMALLHLHPDLAGDAVRSRLDVGRLLRLVDDTVGAARG